MSEDLQTLLVVLGCYYLAECAHWVRPGCVVFVSQLGRRFGLRQIHDRALLRNDHGGLLVGNLLPWGASAQCQFWPVSLAPGGIFSYVSQAITGEGRPEQSAVFHRYDDVEAVKSDGRRVLVNGAPLVTACSAELAGHLARLIGKLAALPAGARAGAIDAALAGAADADEVARRYREARRRTLPLRLLCMALFLYLFAFVPAAVAWDFSWTLLQYLALYAILILWIQLSFRRAAAALLPNGGREANLHAWLMVISPADALHASDKLFRSLLSLYHPLAVARTLAGRPAFEEFARHILRDLREPIRPELPVAAAEAAEVESWFRGRLTERLAGLARAAGLDPEEVHRPPAPDAAECRTYCPRCWGQYRLMAGECHTCGVPLRPLA